MTVIFKTQTSLYVKSVLQFYKCANGSLTLETCGNGLLFNEATALTRAAHNFCSYNWETDCGGRSNDSAALSSPGCPFRFGIFPSGPGCYASYTKCANGIPTEVSLVILGEFCKFCLGVLPVRSSI